MVVWWWSWSVCVDDGMPRFTKTVKTDNQIKHATTSRAVFLVRDSVASYF
jgi:hypothetical protein